MPTVVRYAFTLNNPSDEAISHLSGWPLDKLRFIIFQGEIGEETGTPHLQGYVETLNPMGKKELNQLHFGNRARLDAAKGDAASNIEYCTKDDTFASEVAPRVRNGEPRKHGRGNRSDLDAVQAAIDAGASYDDICDEHFSTVARVDRFVKQRLAARDARVQQQQLEDSFKDTVLWTWQSNLLRILQSPVDPRAVMWYWEEQGNKGKSFMARYLATMHGALILEAGRKVDLAHIIVTTIPMPRIVIFDLSRTAAPSDDGKSSPVDVVYALMESLKNGYIVSTKYESKGLSFPVPHVLVFANFHPDESKMSFDRWMVLKIA